MNEMKLLQNALQEAVNAVKAAEKKTLDTDWSEKLNFVGKLVTIELEIAQLKEYIPVPEFTVDENTKLAELYEEGILGIRPYTYCSRAGLNTVGQVCERTEEELMRIRNMGTKATGELLEVLHQNGLRVKNDKTVNVGGEKK